MSLFVILGCSPPWGASLPATAASPGSFPRRGPRQKYLASARFLPQSLVPLVRATRPCADRMPSGRPAPDGLSWGACCRHLATSRQPRQWPEAQTGLTHFLGSCCAWLRAVSPTAESGAAVSPSLSCGPHPRGCCAVPSLAGCVVGWCFCPPVCFRVLGASQLVALQWCGALG